jgi:SAM-dependent methyltransferase
MTIWPISSENTGVPTAEVDWKSMECIVCSAKTGREHVFREMMFGTRKEFRYWECLACGCLQIEPVPDDLGEHYPDSYHSFSTHYSAWKKWYYRAHFAAPTLMRRLRRCSADISSVIATEPRKDWQILDVGSGAGRLVEILRSLGFNAHGIDPFLTSEGPYVRRMSLQDVGGIWDLIMFQHSLEHMQNHVEVLRCARSKLAAGGTCLVRIPIATWAWKHYGKDWVQLDVPRHLVIHTPESFRLTAESAGFQITQTVFDSNEFQFSGSELYRRDFSLHDVKSNGLFSSKCLRGFRAQADMLNREQNGDQAAFFLSIR